VAKLDVECMQRGRTSARSGQASSRRAYHRELLAARSSAGFERGDCRRDMDDAGLSGRSGRRCGRDAVVLRTPYRLVRELDVKTIKSPDEHGPADEQPILDGGGR